tara:strand:- start:123 stop:863 length:741 start_codon:yes stop_codon:yes gene_type:complete
MNKKKIKNKAKVIRTIKPVFNNNLFTEVQKNSIISTVIEYAGAHPEMLTPSMKKVSKHLLDIKIKKNISITLDKVIETNNKRTTSPDELTSLYLENYYGHQKNNRNLYIDGYAVQKKAEMQIGELLELYIQKEFFKYGWCCSGSTIEHVDFVKKKENNWEVFQIKNSDNTENNAASGVRKIENKQGIKKWVRRNSKHGLNEYINQKKILNLYFWDDYPDEDIKIKLSEKAFRIFIKNYFNNITQAN